MKKTKILFDYSPAYKPTKTGIPIFISELYSALSKIETIQIEKTYDISQVVSRKHYKLFRFFEKILYQKIYIPLKLKLGNYDVYVENQYMFIPLFKPKNVQIVNMVFDIGLILFDTIHTQKHIENWRKKFPISLKNTDLIITLSQASKSDISNYLKKDLSLSIPISYIYADASPKKISNKESQIILNKYKIDTDYFLFLGTLEPRKNPLNLLKAFHLFKQNNPSTIKLVFAGKKGWLYQEIFTYIHMHNLEDDVIFTGYISDNEKYALLQHTRAFLFLSLYEGFGIPALEALKLNIPTLVSDIDVFHELFQNNVLYASTTDIDNITKQMQQILINPPRLNKLLLKKFSWEKSAHKFVNILRNHSTSQKEFSC